MYILSFSLSTCGRLVVFGRLPVFPVVHHGCHGSPHLTALQKSPSFRNGRFSVSHLGSRRLANALARKAPGESTDRQGKWQGKMLHLQNVLRFL